METKKPIINHVVAELFNINEDMLFDYASLEISVEELILRLNLKVVKKDKYDFSPQGTTAFFILSSSHLAVHTWPENKYLHLDLITCQSLPGKEELNEILSEIFKVKREQVRVREIPYD
jgi:S-adenosylmethionine decarboxylase proenzyme